MPSYHNSTVTLLVAGLVIHALALQGYTGNGSSPHASESPAVLGLLEVNGTAFTLGRNGTGRSASQKPPGGQLHGVDVMTGMLEMLQQVRAGLFEGHSVGAAAAERLTRAQSPEIAVGDEMQVHETTNILEEKIHLVVCVGVVFVFVLGFAAVCSGMDGPPMTTRNSRYGHLASPEFSRGTSTPKNDSRRPMGSSSFGGAGLPSRSSSSARAPAACQLLLDMEAIRRGTWPLSLSQLDGRVSYTALMSNELGNQRIQLCNADAPRTPLASITSALEVLNGYGTRIARLESVGPSTYALEAASRHQGQNNMVFRFEQSGVLIVQSRESIDGSPLATAAPVWYLRECLEVALSPHAQQTIPLVIVGVLGILVFQSDRVPAKMVLKRPIEGGRMYG